MATFSRSSRQAPQWVRSKPFYSFATFAVLAFFFVVFVSFTPYPVSVPSSVASISTHSRDFLKQHINIEHIEHALHQEKPVTHDTDTSQKEYEDPLTTHHKVTSPQDAPTLEWDKPSHPRPSSYHEEQKEEESIAQHDDTPHEDSYQSGISPPRPVNAEPLAVHIPGVKAKHAFATFLVGADKAALNGTEDRYFIATRLLIYQVLHAKETRTNDKTTPFIVLVTDRVSEEQRERLRKDGAAVVQVPGVTAPWLKPLVPGWDDVLTKLRLYEFVDFERIAFLDVDTILAKPIGDIFDDPAVREQKTLPHEHQRMRGAIKEPDSYVFAGNAEHTREHHFPPTQDHRDWPNRHYLNAGFFVLKPDPYMLKYYMSVLNTPNSFVSDFPEQNLMNEIHSHGRNMPWLQLNTMYNIHYPTMEDIEAGAKTIHEKYWIGKPGPLRMWMEAKRRQMEGYYEAMDELASTSS
ncbi:hypothetical protein CAC42_5053 [Sphaceloma murrayae]|uniref:Uncharacterized protein n=1 Tax=Sphaceloma murrayae TaxID=2082308 RepID=A0A2K1QTX1_9PEZI|nr:hypothetical protein CAC42_5053 [Sphaceloma murrayae]